jgi:cytochrome c oxidase subunit 4
MSDEHAHGEAHHINYFGIFMLLCVCTVFSVAFDVFQDSMSRAVLVVLVLAVAVCKATFVLLYFMHIKFEAAWKYVLLAPTSVLALALPFALAPDISFHYYNVIVPQSYAIEGEKEASHHSAAPHLEHHEVPPVKDEHHK